MFCFVVSVLKKLWVEGLIREGFPAACFSTGTNDGFLLSASFLDTMRNRSAWVHGIGWREGHTQARESAHLQTTGAATSATADSSDP
jgi:hypothetical protein